eukprot:scaffold2791_cov154-Amphora_coffeaeformis.AAC.8
MGIRFYLSALAVANLTRGLIQPGRVKASVTEISHFENWLDVQGVERSVRIQDDTKVGGGRGLVATQRLEPGDVAAWVPVSATIRVEGGGLFDDDNDNWAGVMAAKLMRETEIRQGSVYFEYLTTGLPNEAPTTPCRWTSRNRASLQNSTFVEECLRNSVWRRQQAVLHGGGRGDKKSFMRMIDLVCSRTLRGRDGSRQLVPLIDIANHAPEEAGGGHFSVDETGNVALIVGRRGVDKGQPVAMDYGGRRVEDFLLHYGFVPNRCASDSVTIDIDGKPSHLSWGNCEEYRGHKDVRVREICAEKLQSFPTSLKEDTSFLNNMPTVVSEALRAALSYRIAKKSLLSCLSGVHDY